MEMMILGLAIFIGMHSLNTISPNTRLKLIDQLGINGFKAVYSLISLAGFVCIVTGYPDALARMDWGWSPPTFTKHITLLLMLFVCILLVSTYIPNNHIKGKLKHPMILSVKVWALAHLIANGQGANVVLFASFLIWSVLNFRAARKRDKKALIEATSSSSSEITATAPHYSGARTLICIATGIALWIIMIGGLHYTLFGVYPVMINGLVGPT